MSEETQIQAIQAIILVNSLHLMSTCKTACPDHNLYPLQPLPLPMQAIVIISTAEVLISISAHINTPAVARWSWRKRCVTSAPTFDAVISAYSRSSCPLHRGRPVIPSLGCSDRNTYSVITGYRHLPKRLSAHNRTHAYRGCGLDTSDDTLCRTITDLRLVYKQGSWLSRQQQSLSLGWTMQLAAPQRYEPHDQCRSSLAPSSFALSQHRLIRSSTLLWITPIYSSLQH